MSNKSFLQSSGIYFHKKGINTHVHPNKVKKHLGFPKKVSVFRNGQLGAPFHMLAINSLIE
jgi:hypothetical protein